MERSERWFGWAFLVATALLVAAAAFGVQLNASTTLVVLLVGVVLLGLPHGALDPLVARKAFAEDARYSSLAFYAAYLFAVCLYALLWIGLPTLGLAGFLMISAYHFGSDWSPRGTALTRLGYGLTVVTLPSVLHGHAVEQVFASLGTGHAQTLVAISRVLAPFAVAAAGVGAVLQLNRRGNDLVEFLAIAAGALVLEPLVFFTCYFSLLHSPRHLLETAQEVGLKNLRSIALKALPVLIATLVLGGLFYMALPAASMGGRIVMTVFIGLAALTVPHMLLETLATESRRRSC
jgi:Brp/Blh family beta-carotene 15,15'-monooxygenase